MRTVFSIVSIVLLLLAIASFVAVIVSLKPTLEFTFMPFRSLFTDQPVEMAVGTVTDVSTTSSSSRSLQRGTSYSTGTTTVTIEFQDPKGRLFAIDCAPIFNPFKEKATVKVLYCADKFNEKDADENAKLHSQNPGSYFSPAFVPGIPVSLIVWIQRPVMFLVIGIVLLILRFPVGQLRQTFP